MAFPRCQQASGPRGPLSGWHGQSELRPWAATRMTMFRRAAKGGRPHRREGQTWSSSSMPYGMDWDWPRHPPSAHRGLQRSDNGEVSAGPRDRRAKRRVCARVCVRGWPISGRKTEKLVSRPGRNLRCRPERQAHVLCAQTLPSPVKVESGISARLCRGTAYRPSSSPRPSASQGLRHGTPVSQPRKLSPEMPKLFDNRRRKQAATCR
jgi:hypothetical protein